MRLVEQQTRTSSWSNKLGSGCMLIDRDLPFCLLPLLIDAPEPFSRLPRGQQEKREGKKKKYGAAACETRRLETTAIIIQALSYFIIFLSSVLKIRSRCGWSHRNVVSVSGFVNSSLAPLLAHFNLPGHFAISIARTRSHCVPLRTA